MTERNEHRDAAYHFLRSARMELQKAHDLTEAELIETAGDCHAAAERLGAIRSQLAAMEALISP